jgi:hypothetical protein
LFVDIPDLRSCFDTVLNSTNEELGHYYYQIIRNDGYKIICIISPYKQRISIIISSNLNAEISSLSIGKCSKVRVIDKESKVIELFHDNGRGRGIINLLGNPIYTYND